MPQIIDICPFVPKFAKDIPDNVSSNMHKISTKYVKDLSQICTDMPYAEIYPRYAQNIPKICQNLKNINDSLTD